MSLFALTIPNINPHYLYMVSIINTLSKLAWFLKAEHSSASGTNCVKTKSLTKIVNNHFRQADSKSVEMCNSTLHTLPAYGPEISIFIKKGFVSVDCALILKKVT